jgi:excisionase family DNA binding protein
MEHFMTSEEIAELLHVDPVTIRRLVNKNELSAYRIGADYRFAPSDLQNYLQRQRLTAHAENKPDSNPKNPLDQLAQLFRKGNLGKNITPAELMDHFERFEHFTKRVRQVLLLAQEEAQRFQHNYIGTEHLLLGLIREKEGVAAQVLTNLGLKEEQIRHMVEGIIGHGDRAVSGKVGLTPRAKKVIALAVGEARSLNHHFVGTEHILLGLIAEGHGIAADVLKKLDLQLDQVRTETLQVLSQQPQEQEQEQEQEEIPVTPDVPSEALALLAEEEAGLTCTSCGAHCPDYFRHCFNCGQPLIHGDE